MKYLGKIAPYIFFLTVVLTGVSYFDFPSTTKETFLECVQEVPIMVPKNRHYTISNNKAATGVDAKETQDLDLFRYKIMPYEKPINAQAISQPNAPSDCKSILELLTKSENQTVKFFMSLMGNE
jgi:hypothetical protein